MLILDTGIYPWIHQPVSRFMILPTAISFYYRISASSYHHITIILSCTDQTIKWSDRHTTIPSHNHLITPSHCQIRLSLCHYTITSSHRHMEIPWYHISAYCHFITPSHHQVPMSSHHHIMKSLWQHISLLPYSHHHVIISVCRHINMSPYHHIPTSAYHVVVASSPSHHQIPIPTQVI